MALRMAPLGPKGLGRRGIRGGKWIGTPEFASFSQRRQGALDPKTRFFGPPETPKWPLFSAPKNFPAPRGGQGRARGETEQQIQFQSRINWSLDTSSPPFSSSRQSKGKRKKGEEERKGILSGVNLLGIFSTRNPGIPPKRDSTQVRAHPCQRSSAKFL